jgi:hypothetical protein
MWVMLAASPPTLPKNTSRGGEAASNPIPAYAGTEADVAPDLRI